MDFLMPMDGSVLVVDDQVNDALPLMRLLASNGIACTYYSATEGEALPKTPTQKIRVAFFDLQLIPSLSNVASYVSVIIGLIDKLITTNNGPYVLALWTSRAEQIAEDVAKRIQEGLTTKKPLAVIHLSKSDYFESVPDENVAAAISNIKSDLVTRFGGDDLKAIEKAIQAKFVGSTTNQYKRNAFVILAKDLQTKLREVADPFQIFTYWEGVINKAAGKTVEQFASLLPADGHWSQNQKTLIMRMAMSQLEKSLPNADNDTLVGRALHTLNHVFLDHVDSSEFKLRDLAQRIGFDQKKLVFGQTKDDVSYEIKLNSRSKKFRVFVNGKHVFSNQREVPLTQVVSQGKEKDKPGLGVLVQTYQGITPMVNTKLHMDVSPQVDWHVQPGNIYIKPIQHPIRRRTLLKTYYDGTQSSKVFDSKMKCILSLAELKRFIFVELEISPVCDFAQNKRIKYRLLPGVMVPEEYAAKSFSSESVYKEIPPIVYNGTVYKLIFDFKLFKSADMGADMYKQPIMRFRSEALFAIISKLSGHVGRIGITSLA